MQDALLSLFVILAFLLSVLVSHSNKKTASENALPEPDGTLSQCCPNGKLDAAIAETLVCEIFRLAKPRTRMNEQSRANAQVQQSSHDAPCNGGVNRQ